jgi:hypothetical protein
VSPASGSPWHADAEQPFESNRAASRARTSSAAVPEVGDIASAGSSIADAGGGAATADGSED